MNISKTGLGSAKAVCTRQAATEETRLRLSKNWDVGSRGGRLGGKAVGGELQRPAIPKTGDKTHRSHLDSRELGRYFPPSFSYSFQQTKCHEKNRQEPSMEEHSTKWGQHSPPKRMHLRASLEMQAGSFLGRNVPHTQ